MAERFWQACPKRNLCVQGNFLRKNIFSKNNCSSWSFLVSSQNFSELWGKYFSTFVRTAFYVARGKVWAKIYFPGKIKLFIQFRSFSRNILGLLAENFQQGRQNRILGVQRNVLKESRFLKRLKFLLFFVFWPEKNLDFSAKRINGVVQIFIQFT